MNTTISINQIFSAQLKEATAEYKSARKLLAKANRGEISKSEAMKALNAARLELQEISKTVYSFFYNR